MDNELALLERLAGWLESQGASVKSTHFSYSDNEASISAVIDLSSTEVAEREGVKEYRELMTQARAALDLEQQILPSTLEVVAKNMAKTALKLQSLARRRGPDYLFDLYVLVEKEKESAVQEDSEASKKSFDGDNKGA